MTDKAKKYLSDSWQAINLIQAFIKDTPDFASYQTDLKTKSAVERQLAIIGEAINKFKKEETDFKLTHTKQIIDFRNRIIHAYDSLDDAIVWAILHNHLPVLKNEVAAGLNNF
jgi:uncharacterized protein with HEPN domain